MFICGVGRTKFGILEKAMPELMYEATLQAIEDSRISVKDIQAIVVSNFAGGPAQGQLHLGSLSAGMLPGLDVPSFRIEAACASGGMAFCQSLELLRRYENVLVVGVEKLTDTPARLAASCLAMAGDLLQDQREGVIFPAQYAIIADQYMRRYGISHDDLSLVSYLNHRTASRNSLAHFFNARAELDEIKRSPVICSPLNLFDCCPLSDGAAALVLSRKRVSKRDVSILSSVARTGPISLTQRDDLTTFAVARKAASEAFKEAGITPLDIDLAEVHDCFSIAEVVAIEDIGICQKGEGPRHVRRLVEDEGVRPFINSDGGLIGDGHPIGATGIGQIYELVQQIRGEAEDRQLEGIKVGLAHNIGGAGGTAVVSILSK